MISKISYIKNMGVFKNFKWDNSVKSKEEIAEFKSVNILYGQNYSGKTTLSRIIRGLEIGYISSKYKSHQCKVLLGDDEITETCLSSHDQTIRVFNEDFTRENLLFITNDDADINSFAILGEDNADIQEKIKRHEIELGSNEDKSGLIWENEIANDNFNNLTQSLNEKKKSLDDRLREKAKEIKNNRDYDNVNYQINNIKGDISLILGKGYPKTDDITIKKHESTLREQSKEEITIPAKLNLKFHDISQEAKELVEKKVQVTNPVQEWSDNLDLGKWVEQGRHFHENERTQCAFCGSEQPQEIWQELWNKLDEHFNEESKFLAKKIDSLLTVIDAEKQKATHFLIIQKDNFYAEFFDELDVVQQRLSSEIKAYERTLGSLEEQLRQRKNNILSHFDFISVDYPEVRLTQIRDDYVTIIGKSNEYTNSLTDKQTKARTALRLHKVDGFINDIGYNAVCDEIDKLEKEKDALETRKKEAYSAVVKKREEIASLVKTLQDEKKGADKVNSYLTNFFGHQFLSLRAIEEDNSDDRVYRFEVTRNGEKAFLLSEGECSLIAFCYFMAKLDDINTRGKKPIIWIDDPISSLDSNHIFFIYSLIKSEIVDKKEYLQLFISTHNLNFLKYLKRISKDYTGKNDNRSKIREFFLIERLGETSDLRIMPSYLKNHVTEFSYLFENIYKCSCFKAITDDNYSIFYNFGNNARKFFEIYLYYKYPDEGMNMNTLKAFFDEDIPAVLVDRINNEHSHLAGSTERGMLPIEVPEMKKSAELIINTLETRDKEQFDALKKSIGIKG